MEKWKIKKYLIEHDLPLEEISEESAREKYVKKGHISTLHVWWARRPLASSRAVAFASLMEDPGSKNPKKRKELLEICKNIVHWDNVKKGNSNNIRKAKNEISKNWKNIQPVFLDPFSGGGSLSLEALRLGCNVISSELNPVAILLEKATLEWPQKYGVSFSADVNVNSDVQTIINKRDKSLKYPNMLSYLVKKWANYVKIEVKKEIGQFYYYNNKLGKEWIPFAYYWIRSIPCQNPNCGAQIPLIPSFLLSKKKGSKVAFMPIVDASTKHIKYKILEGIEEINNNDFDPNEGTVTRANANCIFCGQVTKAKQVRALSLKGEMKEQLEITIYYNIINKTRKYLIANKRDHEEYDKAKSYLDHKIKQWPYVDNPIPLEDLPLMSGTFNVPLYGFDKWYKLFNARQLLSMITFVDKIKSSNKLIYEECMKLLSINDKLDMDPNELANVVSCYIALMFTRFSTRNTNLSVWHTGQWVEKIFGFPAIPMQWIYPETNIFQQVTVAGFQKNIQSVLNVIDTLCFKTGNINILNQSATRLSIENDSVDVVITDPPYYNNVPYADLSDFFYVWLKKAVGDLQPTIFQTPLTPKDEEICEMVGWDSERYGHKDKDFFERQITKAFKEIYRVLKQDGISVIIYGYKTTEGWEAMLNGLLESNFVITASWPIHAELKSRLRAKRSASISSNIYMVCRKMERAEIGFWNDIQIEIKNRVEQKLNQFWNKGVTGGDFFISAIGPGMEVFSKYKTVETYAGVKVNINDLLNYIRSISANYVINLLLSNDNSYNVDKESQLYLAFRWTYMDSTVEYDDLRILANALGVHIDNMSNKTTYIKQTTKFVEFLGPKKREYITKPSCMIDIIHNSLILWEMGKTDELKEMLKQTGYGADEGFWKYCQALAESLLQGNKEKQLLEGLLVGRDRYSDYSKVKGQKNKLDFYMEKDDE